MAEVRDRAVEALDKAHERGATVLAELVATASAGRVFGEPVVAGERTVITAAEIHTGLGFGNGLATGWGSRGREEGESAAAAGAASSGRGRCKGRREGPQGGGGGGGAAGGRPVAVITITPNGVHVQPVVDHTKVVVTALTALGAIGMTLIRLRRASRRYS